ncbi:N-acetyltransferase [Halanaerobium salsuginis]|uniref:Acetyltransferase (GNAT) family protein n=1 Tax=Halanaerobium salsuginis TaxID=29563 RepID=A0A1I4KCI0_9FIRM|nr:N-acetyltransferase [Halanaerobium salsuginis]SFL76494.1 Acetyltransferase (GNAT) family protein [Halanaerobium salsuginis]
MYIKLNSENIRDEHICCAISDKKCSAGYQAKKVWLSKEFKNGYNFYRLDKRAKVFIEYGPAEKAWLPIKADNYMFLGCFWVSGLYKKKGHGKMLLAKAIEAAKEENMAGLVTVVGKKKYHFMSDGKWLKKQGFKVVDETPAGFVLLRLKFGLDEGKTKVEFKKTVRTGECPDKEGYVVYYTERCPYSEYHATQSFAETGQKRGFVPKVIKLTTLEMAQSAPTPATIFSLFYNGKFVTTDLSVCMDSRFDKIVSKFS